MLMKEFIEKYCADIKAVYMERPHILDDFDLPYDDEIEDDSGQLMKVIYCGEKAIPIMDILTSTREDFARLYPSFECRELYDRYVDSLIMLEGVDALNHIKEVMNREKERIQSFSQENSLSEMV